MRPERLPLIASLSFFTALRGRIVLHIPDDVNSERHRPRQVQPNAAERLLLLTSQHFAVHNIPGVHAVVPFEPPLLAVRRVRRHNPHAAVTARRVAGARERDVELAV